MQNDDDKTKQKKFYLREKNSKQYCCFVISVVDITVLIMLLKYGLLKPFTCVPKFKKAAVTILLKSRSFKLFHLLISISFCKVFHLK